MPIPLTTPGPNADQLDFVTNRIGAWFNVLHIGPLVGGVVTWLFIIAAITMFLCIILSAAQWILGGDDKAGLQKARSRLTNCLVGLCIVSFSLAFMALIQYFFDINIFTDT